MPRLFRDTRCFFTNSCAVALACIALLLPAVVSAQAPTNVDRILVEKSKRALTLLDGTKVVKTYKVALGRNPQGAKDRQGDHRTPEGTYSIDVKKPDSRFHKALHISYPSQADREHAQKLGLSPGGDVEIHGLGSMWGWLGAQHRRIDWTDGCIAVTNEEIDEIYPLIKVGTPVEIRP
jgi:murein L,D-transpeptidase YafK